MGFFNFMAKNKSSEIPHYEMLYIVANKYSEDELKPIVENVNKTIEKEGGKITYEESWGKKKLAYPIQHFHYGYYTVVEFDIPAKKMAKLNDLFRMSAEILRHMIVSKKKLSEEEIKKKQEEKEKLSKKEEKKEEKKDEKAKLEEEKKKGSVKLEELDEKLDKILDTNDLL